MVAFIVAILAGLAAILAVSTTASPFLGLIVFAGLFLLLSGGGLSFITTLSIPWYIWAVIILLVVYSITKKK